jgi:hypothetical protein
VRHRGWRRQADARLDEFATPDEPVRPHPQAIIADDELIDAVVQGRLHEGGWPGGWDPDEPLAAMLSAWRADAGAEPVRRLISVDTARAAIARGRSQRRHRPLGLAAALLVVVGTGLTIAAGTAQPGDPLWGLSRVVDSERAASVTVALKVKSELATARTALAQGREDVAAATLAQVQDDLPAVRPEEGRDALAAEQRNLSTQVDNPPPAGPGTLPSPSTTNPTPTATPPPDIRADQAPPAGPTPGSASPNAAAPPANASAEPPPVQQPSNLPPANPQSDNPPPGNPSADSPPDNAAAANSPPGDGSPAQATRPAPPAHQPVIQLQLGNGQSGTF